MYFLAMWLGTSLLSDMDLDYYIYDRFCENPGNQCFVLGHDGCKECLQQSREGSHFDDSRCNGRSVNDVINAFKGKSAQNLYDKALNVEGGGALTQVFDVLL